MALRRAASNCDHSKLVANGNGRPFVTRNPPPQLGALLRAVSSLRPAQGYVQGMSFLGAILLEVMPVEEVRCVAYFRRGVILSPTAPLPLIILCPPRRLHCGLARVLLAVFIAV